MPQGGDVEDSKAARTIQDPEEDVVIAYQGRKRTATVYDAVAGKIGLNGFLTHSQLESGKVTSSTPDEVLLRRVGAPDEIPFDFYDQDQKLTPAQKLPDSDLLKDLHQYTSDFYKAATENAGESDFRSMDETALLALGVLLEEACKEALGENGDMVLVEPEGLENGLPPSKLTKYQVIGKVVPQPVEEYQSPSDDSQAEQNKPRKRGRYRYSLENSHVSEDDARPTGYETATSQL